MARVRDKVIEALDIERWYTEVGDLVLQDTGPSWQALCPFHEDSSPSLSIRKKDGVFNCFGCPGGNSGSVFDFYMKTHNATFREAIAAIGEFAGLDTGADAIELSEESVNEWHQSLLKNKTRLRFLTEKRGLTLETIKKYKLGHDEERYTIPVYDKEVLVNVRRYLPNAPKGVDKVKGLFGHNERRLLFTDVFGKKQPILICEGEMDTIFARQSGFNATTVTSGAGNWVAAWNDLFKGEDAVIGYDHDKQGRTGTEKVGRYLLTTAISVRSIRWPEGFADKGDVTDFLLAHGAGELASLIEGSEDFVPSDDPATGSLFPLTDLGNAERLIAAHGEDFVFVEEYKKFYVWNGERKWSEDLTARVERWAHETIRAMSDEAKTLSGEAASKLVSWEKTSESIGRINAMVEAARQKHAVSAGIFNKDIMLLNTPSGIVDLTTGKVDPALDPKKLYITMCTGLYEPEV